MSARDGDVGQRGQLFYNRLASVVLVKLSGGKVIVRHLSDKGMQFYDN
jgi:hypothetical protein